MRTIAQRIRLLLVAASVFLVRWSRIVAVDLFQDQQRIWLIGNPRPFLRLLHIIIPRERLQTLISPRFTIGIEFFQAFPQVIHEPQVGTSIPGRINRFVAPLQHALRIGETALFLCRSGGRQEKDFRLDLAGIHRLRLWPEPRLPVPERCRFYLVEVTYHHPV